MLKFLCLFAFVAGALATSNQLGPKNATRGQFPYQAYFRIPVRYSKEDFISCGAVIITNRFVLTTASCVHDFNHLDRVPLIVGATRAGPKITDGTKYTVDIARTHPKFHTSKYLNDIAVVRIIGSISFKSTLVRPIALPVSDLSTHSPAPAVTSGWGAVTLYPLVRAVNLRWKHVSVIGKTECNRLKGKYDELNADTLCTKNPSGTGKDIHYRGAALTTFTSPKQLVGLNSDSPFEEDIPINYYTNVFHHLTFIHESMQELAH